MADIKVTVSSAHGKAIPPNGIKEYPKDSTQTFSVDESSVIEKGTVGVLKGWKKNWKCVGWTGTGSFPSRGVGTSVTVPLHEDSTLTWIWVGGQVGTQIFSIVAFAIIISIAAWATLDGTHAFIVSASAGAVGGMLHEIVQSGGKYILPNTDESGNFVLGGLIGIVTGTIAGILMYQGKIVGTAGPVVSMSLMVEALVAGLAVKGVADAPNPR